MALKRQYDMTSIFSMASMTDIIFLLLIFFMVTSTYVFPTALELNLPQSSEQTAIRPATRVYVFTDGRIVAEYADESPVEISSVESLEGYLVDAQVRMPAGEAFTIAIYADEDVPYGNIVKILDIGARKGMKMVLATKAAPSKMETADKTASADGMVEASATTSTATAVQ
ncbi:MAG: biopolymer transporter ExbD [Bacteroides sp.]|nr:biopolymer transporter ExbD [Bacteroides sp.]MCM1413849.1 biopolymer transporter ExbD [Bacteroides sp.]MCM1471042.1 biopolymer transporter ExbD [Bacteroides sp.]